MAKPLADYHAVTSTLPKGKRKWLKWSLVTIFALGIFSVLTDDENADQPGTMERQTQSKIALKPHDAAGSGSAVMDHRAGDEEPTRPNLPLSNALPSKPNTAQADSPAEMSQRGASEELVAPETNWNVHDFKVVEDEDISSSNRFRRRVTSVCPEIPIYLNDNVKESFSVAKI